MARLIVTACRKGLPGGGLALLLGALVLFAALAPPRNRPGAPAPYQTAAADPLDSVSGLTRLMEEMEERGEQVPDYLEHYLWWYRQRAFPFDRVNWAKYPAAERQRARMLPAMLRRSRRGTGRAVPSSQWEFLGPTNLPVPYRQYYGPLESRTSGRVNGTAFGSGSGGIYYVSTAGGGVWKTTDSGNNWVPLSDRWQNLVTGGIAVHPSDPNTIYAGTGDPDGSKWDFGFGLMKSTDGGANWVNISSTQGGTSLRQSGIRRIAFNPSSPAEITACASDRLGQGMIFFSRDAGASWSAAVRPGMCWGVSYSAAFVAPNGSSYRRCYVAESTLGGFLDYAPIGDWTASANMDFPPVANRNVFQYVDVAASTTNRDIVYVLTSTDPRRTAPGEYHIWRGDWAATPPGAIGPAWTDVTNNFPMGPLAANGVPYNWSQANYDFHIECVPDPSTGRDVVYVGLIDLVASTDQGATWNSVGHTYDLDAGGNAVALTHNDQHILAPDPNNGNVMLVGNDGGVYRLTHNAGNSWNWEGTLSARLGITQFYQGAYHPSDPSRMIGGSQDNASPVCLGDFGNWSNKGGGDGGFCAVDRFNASVQYASSQVSARGGINQVNLYRTDTQWTTSADLPHPIGGDSFAFIYPVTLDPSSTNLLYVGTNFLYRYDDRNQTWADRLGGQALASGRNYITYIAVAPGDGSRIYTGSSDGQVWMTADAGTTWTQINAGSTSLPNRSITSIAVDPNNSSSILVAVSGTGTAHLWQCADTRAGQRTWSAVSGSGDSGLPDIPCNTVALDRDSPATTWFAGTDVGVFYTTNGGVSWTNATTPLGLPNVMISRLEVVPGTGYLMAATFGRGMWRVSLGTPPQTFSISGRVATSTAGLEGVTVTAGGRSASTASDGTYTISGLAPGDYSVRPARTGFAFAPVTRAVTLNGANATGIDFTATALFTISGTVRLNGAGLAGVTVQAVSDPPTQPTPTATTRGDGTYFIEGIVTGSWTVSAALSGYTFAPSGFTNPIPIGPSANGIDFNATQSSSNFSIRGTVTENGAGLGGVVVQASTGSSTVNQSASPGSQIADFPGAGVTSEIQIPNTGNVTSVRVGVNIRHTYRGDLEVTLIHPDGTRVALWSHNAHSSDGTDDLVTSFPNDTTPDQALSALNGKPLNGTWRLEVKDLAEQDTGTLNSWSLALGTGGGGAPRTATTGADGTYSLTDVPPGDYTVTPSRAGYTFSPPSRSITLSADQAGVNFAGTSTASAFSVSGTVTAGGTGLGGVTVTAGGRSATTGADGGYSLTGLAAGNYQVSPSKAGFSFTPASRAVTLGPDATGITFTGSSTGGGDAFEPDNTPGDARAISAGETQSRSIHVPGDVDWIRFTLPTTTDVTIETAGPNPNGDTVLTLFAADGTTEIETNDDIGDSNYYSRIRRSGLPAGIYLLRVHCYYASAVIDTYTLRLTATADSSFSISGRVTQDGAGLGGVSVGAGGRTATTAGDGTYTLTGLAADSYLVTPTRAGVTFSPLSRTVTVGPDASGVDFSGAAAAGFAIRGRVTNGGSGQGGVLVRASNPNATSGSASPGLAIPDDDATGVQSGISISAGGSVTTLQVAVNISHTYRGDLQVTLISPDGSRAILFGANAPTGDYGTNVATSFPDQTAPDQDLGRLVGRAAGGTWRLEVRDLAGQDIGTLNSWSLTVGYSGTGNGASATTQADGTYEITGLPAGSYSVTASQSGFLFSPDGFANPVTVGPDAGGINFTASAGLARNGFQVRGRVTAASVGLAGVRVTAGNRSTTTARDGTYVVTGLPEGSVTITPSKAGFTFTPASRTTTLPSGTSTGLDFTATAAGARFSISGTVTLNGSGVSGVRVTAGGITATTGSGGGYTIPGLAPATYMVVPAKTGLTFTPASRSVTVSTANKTGVNFTAAARFSISGTVTLNGTGQAGVTVTAGGFIATTTTTGAYTLSGLPAGSYTVAPAKAGFAYTPVSRSVSITSASVTGVNFSARAVYSIRGLVTLKGEGLAGVTVSAGGRTATTGPEGGYLLAGLPAGSYTVTATRAGFTFTPASRSVSITNANLSAINFAAVAPTFSISGSITLNGAGLGGVTVAAGGKSVTTTASGAYTIPGLASGSYTVKPNRTGHTFTPANRVVQVTNGNLTGINFTASTAAVTYSIRGLVVLNGAGLAGVTVSAGRRTAVTGSGGGYAFTGLPPGSYTVVPSHKDYVFTPASRSLTLSTANLTGVNFAAAGAYSISGRVTLGTAAMSGVTISAGGRTVLTSSTGTYRIGGLRPGSYTVVPQRTGYTFTPSSRSVTITGAALTGVSFNAATTAPRFTLSGRVTASGTGLAGVTVTAGSQTATTGDDGAYGFTGLAAGTVTVRAAKAGFNFTPTSRQVTLGPSASGINFAAVVTYSISGMVAQSNGQGVTGVTVTAGGKTAETVYSSGRAVYTISGLAPGTYTVQASSINYSYTPASRSVTITSADVTGVDFTAVLNPYQMTGFVTLDGAGLAGVNVTVGRYAVPTDASGYFYVYVAPGTYTVTPAKTGYSFTPSSRAVTITNAHGVANFTAIVGQPRSISGTITRNGAALSGVTVQAGGKTTTTGTQGGYVISGLGNGSYTVVPSRTGYTFTPASRAVTISNANVTAVNFTAAADTTTYSIRGFVTLNGAALSGVTLTAGGKTTTTGSQGGYLISGLTAGTYTVTPSRSGHTFTPPSRSVTVGPNATGVDFTAEVRTFSISGRIAQSGGQGVSGVTVTAGGKTVLSDNFANYTISGLLPGTYTVQASSINYTYSPASRSVTITNADVPGMDFTAVPNPYSILGQVTLNGTGLAGVTVTVGQYQVSTDPNGFYQIFVTPGTYTITPAKPGFNFTPASQTVTITNGSAGANFTATQTGLRGGEVPPGKRGRPVR